MHRFFYSVLASLFIFLAVAQTSFASFVLTINYTGDPQYQAAFNSAKSIWESKLSGYQNGVVVARTEGSSYAVGQTVSELFINAVIEPIDGVNGILGSAGPRQTVQDQLNFVLATDGLMRFDSADVANLFANNTLEAVILHEMGHVMGFGTLWTNNGVYVTGTGEFTGANATLRWQSEFGQLGTPNVELGGGTGTANGHWNEVDGGGGLTGITDSLGRDMRDEIMTGWLNPNSFISDMTVASFVDIGFLSASAVAEPSSLALLGCGLVVGVIRFRKKMKNTPTNLC